jgi:hypothetical protein
MKRLVFLLLLITSSITTNAQQGYQSYADGSPATLIKKTDVEGSELLYEKWLPATIKSSNGKEYNNVMVKYNLLEDVPYFLGKGEVTMIFSTPIKEFVINDKDQLNRRIFRAGFPIFNAYTPLTFYEVLVDGKVKLLKKQNKRITEARAYNSATTVKSIVDNISYFIFQNEQLIPVKRDKKFFQNLIGKTPSTEEILGNKKTNLKAEADLITIVRAYN